MEKNLDYYLGHIAQNNISYIVASLPKKQSEFKKAEVDLTPSIARISYYTTDKVFHKTTNPDILSLGLLLLQDFSQLHFFSDEKEFMLKISKKNVLFNAVNNATPPQINKGKNYIIPQGTIVPPLIDMGVINKSGKVISGMNDKFKQINRFLEIIDDSIGNKQISRLNIIDFGCGKSYLTFILYYYLTYIKKINCNIIGLDLKEDVIKACNEAAEKYKYKNLIFKVGDINGFKSPMPVDMVISLHAYDTATDYALFNAIRWGAKFIFSVPCCQHELNQQIFSDDLTILTRYGVAQERLCALFTDVIRCNLLETVGYKTQLLEFIDFNHTPKNLLIRASLSNITKNIRDQRLKEVVELNKEFNLFPKLYDLLKNEHLI